MDRNVRPEIPDRRGLESQSEPGDAEDVLEQHQEEEYRGDAPEQQMHRIGLAVGIARAQPEPGDDRGQRTSLPTSAEEVARLGGAFRDGEITVARCGCPASRTASPAPGRRYAEAPS